MPVIGDGLVSVKGAGGGTGAVSSVAAADGTVTVTPTTGAVTVSAAPAQAAAEAASDPVGSAATAQAAAVATAEAFTAANAVQSFDNGAYTPLSKLAGTKTKWYQTGALNSPTKRTDTVTYSAASSTILDASIGAGDLGSFVVGANIPFGAWVGTVTAGVSFVLSSSPTSTVPLNPTGSGSSIAVGQGLQLFSDTGAGMLKNQWFTMGVGSVGQTGILAITTDGNATPDVLIDLSTLFLQQNVSVNPTFVNARNTIGTVNTSGAGTYVVTHGLGFTPTEVFLGSIVGSVAASNAFFVTAIGATTFTVNQVGTGSFTIAWEALVNTPTGAIASTTHMFTQMMAGSVVTGIMRYPVPYGNGITVTLYNANDATGALNGVFYQTEYEHGLASAPPYRLHSTGVTQANAVTVAAASSLTMFDLVTTKPSWLVWMGYSMTGTTNVSMLERNTSIFIDGEGTASLQSSGVEDFFHSGYYFQGELFMSAPWMMLTSGNQYGPPIQFNMGLDMLELFGGVAFTTECKAVLGTEAAVTSDHTMAYVALYYQHT
jgi:hypothetical protein